MISRPRDHRFPSGFTVHVAHSLLAPFINENHFEHDQIVVERDETAKERQRDEPEQAVVGTGAQRPDCAGDSGLRAR